MSASSPLIDAVVGAHPSAVISTHRYRGDDTVVLTGESMHAVAKFLKEDAATRMNVLMDLTAVDYSAFGQGPMPAFFTSSGVGVRPLRRIPDQDPWPGPPGGERFVVVHHLFSITLKHRLRLVTPVDDGTLTVDTVSDLWPGANWLEREVWDMFGIEFAGHPDLRRLLMYDQFVGHPLRKDYPVKKRQPLIGPVN